MTRYRPAALLPTLALTAALALSACSGGSAEPSVSDAPSTQESTSEFNDADVNFTVEMIPHHQQGVGMSEMAEERGGPAVADLAERIVAAQTAEIETMDGWLQDWDVDEPGGMGRMGDMEMMNPDDMQELMDARGGEFDATWLAQMIDHHEGAITMAQREQAEGVNPAAVDLAATIVDTQQKEIDEMEQMLSSTG